MKRLRNVYLLLMAARPLHLPFCIVVCRSIKAKNTLICRQRNTDG
eukprot:XP_001709164.1 Hypothetical protein GL50803_37211 [Giardia lamblia ATCC 50803]